MVQHTLNQVKHPDVAKSSYTVSVFQAHRPDKRRSSICPHLEACPLNKDRLQGLECSTHQTAGSN